MVIKVVIRVRVIGSSLGFKRILNEVVVIIIIIVVFLVIYFLRFVYFWDFGGWIVICRLVSCLWFVI